jgi:hypothetical protein
MQYHVGATGDDEAFAGYDEPSSFGTGDGLYSEPNTFNDRADGGYLEAEGQGVDGGYLEPEDDGGCKSASVSAHA